MPQQIGTSRKTVATGWLAGWVAVFSLLLSGCWDYSELEKRAFIIGLGIDEAKTAKHPNKAYEITLQAIEPSAETTAGNPGTPGAQSKQGYINFTVTASSISKAIEDIVYQSERLPNLSHLQVLLISEKVAKKGFEDLYDFLARFPQMRRHTEVGITQGAPKEFLTLNSATQPTPAMHIAEVIDANQKTLNMPEGNFGALSKHIREKRPYVLPYLSKKSGTQIKVNQGAVFYTFTMAGTINEEEMRSLAFFQNEIERGNMSFSCDGGKSAVVRILRGKTNLEHGMNNQRPFLHYAMRIEGELIETQCGGQKFSKPEQIKQLEQKFSRQLETILSRSYAKIRDQYHNDFLEITPRLKNTPELYDWIRKEPKSFFDEADIKIDVDLKLRMMGNTVETYQNRRH